MDPGVFFWVLARVAGLTSFAALSISLLTGMAVRTAVLDWLGSSRALRATHEYTAMLWVPLGLLHVAGLLLDQTARIRPVDVVLPFLVPYGTLAVGLGTLSLELFAVVAVTGWLKRRLRPQPWLWLHRLSYAGFALLFLHAALGGTDFSYPLVAAAGWGVTAALAILGLARLLWGRLPA
jgi:methionine sulfoxide reductase heme-binding subunit